jgi:hypothetical protein
MLRMPEEREDLALWARELVDECMRSEDDRAAVYQMASRYYFTGSGDNVRAAIYNKTKPFCDRLSGMLYQPTDVRFSVIYDSSEPQDVVERAQLVGEKLTADFRANDSDVKFSDAVTWSLINGVYLLKVRPNEEQHTFHVDPIHPCNFGVLSETTQALELQEAVCHISYYSVSRLRAMLEEADHPHAGAIIDEVLQSRQYNMPEERSGYVHEMMVGGLHPIGPERENQEASGIINVFPVTVPWRPQTPLAQTVKFCELWFRDADRDGDWTTLQMVYPDLIIWGDAPGRRSNLSRVPGRLPFTKIQAQIVPGYFWGRSVVADVQMLQDVLNRRLRNLEVMSARNAKAPHQLSGFTSVTPEMYNKIMNEGGFIYDANPQASAKPLVEPPPPNYLEEIELHLKFFDEASGFTPVTTGQGESGVRSGVHAQTLVRTSSPRLIDQASRIERQLAETGELALRIMQATDSKIYLTDDTNISFYLEQLPDNFQVIVDSHSASPVFMEDNLQKALILAKAGALDAEDLLHIAHLPGTELFLQRLKQRQKAMAQQAQEQKQEDLVRDVIGVPAHRQSRGGGRRGATMHSIATALLAAGAALAAMFGR